MELCSVILKNGMAPTWQQKNKVFFSKFLGIVMVANERFENVGPYSNMQRLTSDHCLLKSETLENHKPGNSAGDLSGMVK